MRCLIYTRVSSDSRKQGTSVTQQEADVRRWIDARGWTVSDVITDNDISASRFRRKERDGWAEVKDRLAKGDIDVLAVWEGSRATRELGEWALLRDLLRDSGVLLLAGDAVVDVRNVDQGLSASIGAVVNEAESERTRQRIMRSVNARAEAGRPVGKTPYGYRRNYDTGTGALLGQEIDPAQAVDVRRWADQLLTGATTLKALEREVGRSNQFIRRLMLSPTIAGLRVHGDKTYPATWPAIITEAEHRALTRLLRDPSRNVRSQIEGRQHPFTGIVTCGRCDGPMYIRKHPTGLRYGCKELCMSVKAEPVDIAIKTALQHRIDGIDLGHEDDGGQRDALLTQLTELDERLAGAEAAAAEGTISFESLGRVEVKVKEQKVDLERQLDQLDRPIELESLKGVKVDGLDVAKLHWTARQLLNTVKILPAKPGPKFDPNRVDPDWR